MHGYVSINFSQNLRSGFVIGCRERGCTPHVAQNDANRRSAIDGRTTRHAGYAISMIKRKRIEEPFGWIIRLRLRRPGIVGVTWSNGSLSSQPSHTILSGSKASACRRVSVSGVTKMTQSPIQCRTHGARRRRSAHQSWSPPSTKSRIPQPARTLALRAAMKITKRRLQAQVVKVSHFPQREIRAQAEVYLCAHRETLIAEARVTVDLQRLSLCLCHAQNGARNDRRICSRFNRRTNPRRSTSPLLAAGAEKVFAEKVSGAVTERKALARAIAPLGHGTCC